MEVPSPTVGTTHLLSLQRLSGRLAKPEKECVCQPRVSQRKWPWWQGAFFSLWFAKLLHYLVCFLLLGCPATWRPFSGEEQRVFPCGHSMETFTPGCSSSSFCLINIGSRGWQRGLRIPKGTSFVNKSRIQGITWTLSGALVRPLMQSFICWLALLC